MEQQNFNYHHSIVLDPRSHAVSGNEALSSGRGLGVTEYMGMDGKDIFTIEPPSPMATSIVGGVLWVVSFILWIRRVQKLRALKGGKLYGSDLLRAMIACAIDNDSAKYTITSFTAISLLFFAGIQMNYRKTFLYMLGYYGLVSLGDTLRVLLAYWAHDSLWEVFLCSRLDSSLKEKQLEDDREKGMKYETMEIQPTNVYEDMGRDKFMVCLIFFAQAGLIGAVCMDVYTSDVVTCFRGSGECLVGANLGSYGLYIIGILQSCAFLLGPATNYGQSEQNPGFWLILLLASKKSGVRLLWENPVKQPGTSKDNTLRDPDGNLILDDSGNPKYFHCRNLKKGDATMWGRFLMSYLVNGIGFHIIIHALPLQVAASSSYLSIIYRAVGMLYLVNLDDSQGFKLIIAQPENEEDDANMEVTSIVKSEDSSISSDESISITPKEEKIDYTFSQDNDMELGCSRRSNAYSIDHTGRVKRISKNDAPSFDQQAMTSEVERIIEEAEIRLNQLRLNGPPSDWNDTSSHRRLSFSGHRRLSISGHRPLNNNYSGHRRPSVQREISLWNFGATATGRIALNQTATGAVGTTALSQARNTKASLPINKGGD